VNGSSFSDPVPYLMTVQLNGGSANTIVFSNPNAAGYAPGLDNITVSIRCKHLAGHLPGGGNLYLDPDGHHHGHHSGRGDLLHH